MTTLRPRLDLLPPPQRALWPELRALQERFVLYGGTAVALRFGHRSSADFDFFGDRTFDPLDLFCELPLAAGGQVLQSAPNTLTLSLDRDGPVKVSLFGGLDFGRVEDPELTEDGVAWIASPLDLAATKFVALVKRVEPRDYWDLATLLRAGVRLPAALGAARALFGPAFSPMAAVKAAGFFEGADFSLVPRDALDDLAREVARLDNIEDAPKRGATLR